MRIRRWLNCEIVQRALIKITAFLMSASTWAQKSTQKHSNAKGRIEKYPFKVYHIVKPKGNRTMIELKITVNTAVELEQEVKDLYQSIAGALVKDVEPAKKEAPKVEVLTPKAEPVKEEVPAPKEEPKVEETAPTVKPVKEEPAKVEAPTLEATREAVKDVMAKAADKTEAKGEFKAFLDSIGAEKVTSATDEQRIQIMKWVNSRG